MSIYLKWFIALLKLRMNIVKGFCAIIGLLEKVLPKREEKMQDEHEGDPAER